MAENRRRPGEDDISLPDDLERRLQVNNDRVRSLAKREKAEVGESFAENIKDTRKSLDEHLNNANTLKKIDIDNFGDVKNLDVLFEEKPNWGGRIYVSAKRRTDQQRLVDKVNEVVNGRANVEVIQGR